jgi:quercetin dioxygenase-like cupin family protein
VILRGEGRVDTVDRVSGEENTWTLEPEDLFFMGKGEWIEAEAVSDEPFVFFYVALPASSKESWWLAHMTQEDIESIKLRDSDPTQYETPE